jgi:uncharacterized protein YfbU (UPF0304 family)
MNEFRQRKMNEFARDCMAMRYRMMAPAIEPDDAYPTIEECVERLLLMSNDDRWRILNRMSDDDVRQLLDLMEQQDA